MRPFFALLLAAALLPGIAPAPADSAEASAGEATALSLVEQGREHIAAGRHDSAVVALEAAARAFPESVQARELLVHALRMRAAGAWRRSDPAAALVDLNRAWQAAPEMPALRQELAVAHARIGVELFTRGDTEAALTAYRKASELDASRKEYRDALTAIYVLRGRAAEAEGRLLAATADYRRALENDSRSVEAHLLLGRVYYEREDFELARHHLREARRLATTAVRGLDELLARVDREQAAAPTYATLEIEGFVVRFQGSPRPDLFYRVLPTLRDARERASRLMGRRSIQPITVIIYAGDAITRAASIPDWAAGVFDGKVRLREGEINRGPQYLERILRHEIAHAVLEEFIPGRAPAWVHEGLASLVEIERWDRPAWADGYVAAIRAGRRLPLSALERPFAGLPPDADVTLAYAESAAAIRYLALVHGEHAIADLVTLLGAGRSAAQAVDSISFLGPEAFQDRVRDWAAWEYAAR